MRRVEPPPREYFDAARPALGAGSVGIDLDDLRLELAGLDGETETALRARYAPFSGAGEPRASALRVELARDPREYFVDPPAGVEFNPVGLACDGDCIRYVGYRLAGWFEIAGPTGQILLATGNYEPVLRAVENYVRVAVAWRAAARGGALVHAASIVADGRGYLFFGESGAGKSTLAASTRKGRVVSDDLSLVLPGAHGLDLVGSPFRGTYEGGDPVQGRFPLAAAFRLVQAPDAAVVPVPRAIAFGQLVANLTFVAEAFDRRPDLFASVEKAFSCVPLAHLHFRKDDSYWEAISAAGF